MVDTKETTANTPMSLMGPQNLRELGGYSTVYGAKTAKGRLLRSDALHYLTRNDVETLFNYGVRWVIDLRGEAEQKRHPDPFDGFPAVSGFHFPMFDRLPTEDGAGREAGTLAELYIALLEDAKPSFLNTMRAISRVKYGCVLFHCTAGKDRTGMVAMLLLMLAGVPDEVVITDYRSSCDNMAAIFARQKLEMHLNGLYVNEPLFRSSRADIEAAMEHVYNRYGDAESYLRDIGCAQQEIDALYTILLGNSATSITG